MAIWMDRQALLQHWIFWPEKELKGFAKVYLKAGESRQIRIPFDDKTFRYWNIKTGQWETETGTYQIMVGASVADIRLTGMTERTGNSKGYPYNPAKCLTIIQESCRNIRWGISWTSWSWDTEWKMEWKSGNQWCNLPDILCKKQTCKTDI